MKGDITLGRLPAAEVEAGVILDSPQKMVQAMLTKQDEIITKMNLILAAIEAATDGNSLFTALDTAAIKAAIEKIGLYH
jgi:hypothetical protein